MVPIGRYTLKKFPIVALAALLTLNGCAADGSFSKEGGGTLIGGGLGGLLGSRFGKGTGQLAMTAIGTGLGAWAGNRYGAYLDQQDQARAAKSMQDTLNTGRAASWENPRTGVGGTTRVTNTDKKRENMQIPVLKDRVQEIPPLDLVGETYVAPAAANIRGGPGTDYRVVDTLPAGRAVQVVGRVQGKPWLLVAEGDAASGFAHADTLRRSPGQAPSPSTNSESDVEEVTVAADQTCRTVTQSITLANGDKRDETVTACQGPNGWEVI